MRYPAIKPKRYSGNEEIVSESGEKIATIGDFWSWAYSDVLGNTERGVLAEFLVANALGIQKKDRIAWDKYDLLLEYCGRNISVEVKSSGYF